MSDVIARLKVSLLLACLVLLPGPHLLPAAAQGQDAEAEETVIEEIVVIGSRKRGRSAAESTAPIDVISGETFGQIGNSADISDNLRVNIPSFNASTASGDGDTFVRPTSLRGLAPDQTLVMVNGKRRHRAALIAEFVPSAGKGAHGPNIGMLPGIAFERIEVLRDGASAQYGADAIAGVINFVTRDASEGGELRVQYGQFYEGEQSYSLAGNVGLSIGERGFLNLSAEYSENDALSRGIQRASAQALIDAGVPGVGADSPFDDAPLAHTWGGRTDKKHRLFFQSGIGPGRTCRRPTAQANLSILQRTGFLQGGDQSTLLTLREDSVRTACGRCQPLSRYGPTIPIRKSPGASWASCQWNQFDVSPATAKTASTSSQQQINQSLGLDRTATRRSATSTSAT